MLQNGDVLYGKNDNSTNYLGCNYTEINQIKLYIRYQTKMGAKIQKHIFFLKYFDSVLSVVMIFHVLSRRK